MYDETQVNDKFQDGDVFVCCGGKAVGFLNAAWPIVLYGEAPSLHKISRATYTKFEKLYPKTLALAAQAASDRGLRSVVGKHEAVIPDDARRLLATVVGAKKFRNPEPDRQLQMVHQAAQASANRSLPPVLANRTPYVRTERDGTWIMCDNFERAETILEHKSGRWFFRRMRSEMPSREISFQEALTKARQMFG